MVIFTKFRLLYIHIIFSLSSPGCVVDAVCYSDVDCPNRASCDATTGSCIPWECKSDAECAGGKRCNITIHQCAIPQCLSENDCEDGFTCIANVCRARTLLYCPPDMAVVNDAFCIDRYEASKPDATAAFRGNDTSVATSRAGVRPWEVASNAAALAACAAAGKTLCDDTQWQIACEGPDQTAYSYGDDYESATCNGIDTFCFCSEGTGDAVCSYPECYGDHGAAFQLMPTGSLRGCTNAWGVFDMNGNLWEHVLGGNDMTVRGGAYNCKNSKALHQCSYIPSDWTPSARGFRCCSRGSLTPYDTDTEQTDTDADTRTNSGVDTSERTPS